MPKIGFIGGGKMASALINAILRAKIASADDLWCSDPLEQTRNHLKESLGIHVVSDNREIIHQNDVIFLAFKPQNFPEALAGLGQEVRPDQLIISIMAGVRIAKIQHVLPGKIIRVMPNAACLVNHMAAGFAAAANVTAEEIELVRQLLDSAGVAIHVSEDQLDAVTALSGSGPAFVARLIEAFICAGVAQGLARSTAEQLTLQTFVGTAELLRQWQLSPEELVTMVSSPNGTTVAGRAVLENSDYQHIIEQTLTAAARRSAELGNA